MASKRQVAANRLNARRSTGPQSSEGKERSAKNALRHGLSAKASLLAGEDPEEFAAMRKSVIEELNPESAIECEFVERIVNTLWRLRRIPNFEAAILSSIEASEIDFDLYHHDESDEIISGKTIKSYLQEDLSGKLSRYETTLQRQAMSLLKEVRDMQGRRKDAPKVQAALAAPK